MNITSKKFNQLEYIGEGTEGIVRKYNEDLALKLMYDEEFNETKKKSINVQSKIDDSSFIFPIDSLYIDRKYKGYTQKVLDGKQPTKMDLNNLKHFITMIKEIENDFSILTTHQLLIRDLEPRNSIFYQNKLYIIDTSRYVLEKNLSNILIERQNKRLLNYFFINTLINDTDLSIFDLNEIIQKMSLKTQTLYGDIYENVNYYFDVPIDFSKFLKQLMNELKTEELIKMQEKVLKLK